MATKTTLQEFESVFPKLEADVLEWAKKYNLPQEQLDWFKKVGPLSYGLASALFPGSLADITVVSRGQHTRR